MSLLPHALKYLENGLSAIPVDAKSKKSIGKWTEFQEARMTPELAQAKWTNGQGIAIIAGKVSGNLEFIDLDHPLTNGKSAAKAFQEVLNSWNLGPLLSRLISESTQTKGRFHLAYRFEGKPEGNQKLAQRLATEDELKINPIERVKCMIETRGEGGYSIVAPTPGYKTNCGDWANVPVITADEREALLNAARSLNEILPEETHQLEQGDSPGDDFNKRGSLEEIIVPLGWQPSRIKDQWCRPGKDARLGSSASWNHFGNRMFRVFTSSTVLEPRMYTLFQLYAFLNCGGDFSQAAKELRARGYGQNPQEFARKMSTQPEKRSERRRLVCMDDIEAKDIDWLCDPYFPIGCGYVYFYGDSDLGKSTTVLALLAAWSNGYCPIKRTQIKPVVSIILSAEDSAEYVVKPRLLKLGANMKNVYCPEEFVEEDGILIPDPMRLDEDGAEELQEMIREVGAQVVVIDPLTSYFDGDDMNSRLQARTWSKRITGIAIAERCCPIIIHHVNKGTNVDPRYRGAGSQDFFDASRSALMAVKGAEDGSDNALSHEKHNYSWRGESIGYSFSKEDGFAWTGESDLTAQLVAARQEEHIEPKKVDACKAWILEQLEREPHTSSDLKAGAKLEGFSFATYKRAKDGLRDQVRSWKGSGRDDPWWNELRDFTRGYGND